MSFVDTIFLMKTLKALKKVFKININLVIAIIVALSSFILSVFLINFRFILGLISNSPVDYIDKIKILAVLIISINTSFTPLSAVSTIIISILFGINVAMIIYVYKNIVKTTKSGLLTSTGGFMSGILGIGCASCGAFLFGIVLSFTSVGWVLSLLPYKGAEIGFISVAIFIFAIFMLAKKIEDSKVCGV